MRDDNELIGVSSMTERQKLFAQFDAALLGHCGIEMHESLRPGAGDALRAWADTNGLTVEDERGLQSNSLWLSVRFEPDRWNHRILVFVKETA